MAVNTNGQVWLGSERVDKAPLTAGTTGDDTTDGFAQAITNELVVRAITDNLPRITDGFRVEIPTQATSPGDFTVHNGAAFDRAGRLVENESDPDASKTVNLALPNTTYFIEVELTRTAAYPDARAFWNPEFDNGNDPSGDVRPPGREYKRNVSTQWVPDWTIPPPSTVGFSYTATSPDSIRIPVAILVTDNSAPPRITAGTVPARTVLRQAMAAASTVARCVSTRLMPDSGAITINGVAATVVNNDRENNVLNLAAGVVAAKALGARVIHTAVGAPVYLAERYGTAVPLPLPSTIGPLPTGTQQDCRVRMYQPNEALGMALLQDPYASTGVSDVQIASLKAEIDAMGATIRDMKFGGMVQADPTNRTDFSVGQFAPANSFPLQPRWYDRAGSITGSKSVTITVGDGVLSYGDYDTNGQYFPTPEAAFQAAIDKIAESSGTSGVLHVKRCASGGYDTTATINIPNMSKRLTIVGDGDMSEIRTTGAFPVFTIASGAIVHFENMKLSRNGGSGAALSFGAVGTLTATRCDFDVVVSSGLLNIDANRCTFRATGTSTGVALRGLLLGNVYSSTLTTTVNAAGSHAVQADTSSIASFYGCTITTTGVAVTGAVYQDTACTLAFDGCLFGNISTPTTAWAAVYIGTSSTSLGVTRCSLTGPGGVYGLVSAVNLTRAYIANCPSVSFGPNSQALSLIGGTASKSYTVRDCVFTQASTSGAKNGIGITMADVDGVLIENVRLVDCDYGVTVTGAAVRNFTVRNLTYTNATAGNGKLGISIDATAVTHVTVDDCEISGADDASIAGVSGIYIAATTGAAVSVTKNSIFSLGSATCGTAYGVRTVGGISGVTVDGNRIATLNSLTTTSAISIEDDGTNGATQIGIEDNKLIANDGLGDVFGISVAVYTDLTIADNKINTTGTSATTGTAVGVRWGYNTAATAGVDQQNATLTGNTMTLIENSGAAQCTGMYGAVGVGRTTITANVLTDCKQGAGGGVGIYVDSQLATPPFIRNVIINGNIVTVSDTAAYVYATCILLANLRSTTDLEQQFIIANNDCWNFTSYGINVTVEAGQSTSDVSINGNIAKSLQSAVVGIRMLTCTGFTVCNNNVSLTAATVASNGILVGTGGAAAEGTISGNRVYVATPTAGNYGINATGDGISITGNNVKTGNTRCIFAQGGAALGSAAVTSNTLSAGGGAGITLGGTGVKRASIADVTPTADDGHFLNFPI